MVIVYYEKKISAGSNIPNTVSHICKFENKIIAVGMDQTTVDVFRHEILNMLVENCFKTGQNLARYLRMRLADSCINLKHITGVRSAASAGVLEQ